jgi:hypothetical protein
VNEILPYTDWINALPILTGLLACVIRFFIRWRTYGKATFSQQELVRDFANGVAIAPFMLMIASAFSSSFLAVLLEQSRLIVAFSGMVGLFFLLSEIGRR